MTEDQRSKCQVIIHGAATAGAGIAAGLAQLPGADNALLVPLEVTMILGLGQVFGVQLTESAGKGLVAGYLGTLVGRGISQALFGWIPGLGNALNAATAAGVIETIGWAAAADFAKESNRGIAR